MFHFIEFTVDYLGDLGYSRSDRLEQVEITKGTQLLVQLRPYVVDSLCGPVEMADLFLEDGTTLCEVPFKHFVFVE
jgi:hypothetical protein